MEQKGEERNSVSIAVSLNCICFLFFIFHFVVKSIVLLTVSIY